MRKITFDDVVLVLVAAAVAMVIGMISMITLADKHIDGYYLKANGGSNVCVMAHWTWHEDEAAFCTDDYTKALDVLIKANAQVVKH